MHSGGNPHAEKRGGTTAILVLIAVLSIVLYILLSSFVGYSWLTDTLDAKKSTVLQLVTASTAASAAITLIPDDIGTPIADQLADLSTGLLIVLAVLYAEKYLIPIFMFASLVLLIPAASLSEIAFIFRGSRSFRSCSIKLLCLAILLATVIPISVVVSNSIDSTYHDSIQETIDMAIETEEEVSETDEETFNNVWMYSNLFTQNANPEEYLIHQDFTSISLRVLKDVSLLKVSASFPHFSCHVVLHLPSSSSIFLSFDLDFLLFLFHVFHLSFGL